MKNSNPSSRSRRRPQTTLATDRCGGHAALRHGSDTPVATPDQASEPSDDPTRSPSLRKLLPGAGILAGVILYAYWPTLRWAENAWRNEPDYSHGYLVIPLAGFLLWQRRDSMPGFRSHASLWGLGLIVLAIGMRWLSRLLFADFLDGWSLLLLVGGVIWYLFGPRLFWWSSPAVAFLILMIPLPYQAESVLSWKLQSVATALSTAMLRVFGQPAVSEGHVVWLNDQQLMIEEACSGLRIFIGVGALAFFWAALVTRSWIDRFILLAATVPLAVFVNAARIALVGIAYQFVDDAGSRQAIHDSSGYVMVPIAFVLLWMLKIFWEHLYRPLQRTTARDLRSPMSSPSAAV